MDNNDRLNPEGAECRRRDALRCALEFAKVQPFAGSTLLLRVAERFERYLRDGTIEGPQLASGVDRPEGPTRRASGTRG